MHGPGGRLVATPDAVVGQRPSARTRKRATVKAATGHQRTAARKGTARSAEPERDPGADTEQQGVRSVQRALEILALLTDERPIVTIREIVDATGLAKTTVIRLVSTLEQAGLLWATTGGYLAGPGLW